MSRWCTFGGWLVKQIVVFLCCALYLAVSAPGASAETTKKLVPFQTEVRACSGGLVSISGELLMLSDFYYDSTGGFHDHLSVDWRHTTGIGADGVMYRAVGGLHENFNLNASETTTTTYVDQFVVVSQGGDGNLLVVSRLHITVTPSGEVTAYVGRFTETCVG